MARLIGMPFMVKPVGHYPLLQGCCSVVRDAPASAKKKKRKGKDKAPIVWLN